MDEYYKAIERIDADCKRKLKKLNYQLAVCVSIIGILGAISILLIL